MSEISEVSQDLPAAAAVLFARRPLHVAAALKGSTQPAKAVTPLARRGVAESKARTSICGRGRTL